MGSTDLNYCSSSLNYVSYHDTQSRHDRIGHYNLQQATIQPLAFISGTPINNLYQVIEAGESNIIHSGKPFAASSVKVLPPLAARDVLCVGKNYAEHAKEFNNSGFDSSDKVDQPSHPVIFTKRFTSIIADGDEIYPHTSFTDTLDYEGEIGVIIGKAGFRIAGADAMSHVWGYTIINDVTARERQRDHKQFYIGKSADTFCPMGPIAVPAPRLDEVLRVQTHVNGELRQDATTEDLIFSIPYLIKTMSEGQTLLPGDVLATGTPAGVGIGRTPPVYLKPGDIVAVSVTGLGTLTNRIGYLDSYNYTAERLTKWSSTQQGSSTRVMNTSSFATIKNKSLYYKALGDNTRPPVVFVHGLGASNEYFLPLIRSLELERSHSLHLFDLEGHGLSPTSPLSKLSIESLADDLNGVFEYAGLCSGATVVAHSIGCLVALRFIQSHPGKVAKLILLGPPSKSLSDSTRRDLFSRSEIARTKGMAAVADDVATAETSTKSKRSKHLAITAIRMSLLSQEAEGFAKGCTALAEATSLEVKAPLAHVLFVTGRDDPISTPDTCKGYVNDLEGRAGLEILDGVGHWHVFEDLDGVVGAVESFLS